MDVPSRLQPRKVFPVLVTVGAPEMTSEFFTAAIVVSEVPPFALYVML